MMGESQRRAVRSYRARLTERGLSRFEVLGREADRDLIRALARRLAEDGPDVADLRAAMSRGVEAGAARPGGILAALRRSPLVGVELDLTREREDGRDIAL